MQRVKDNSDYASDILQTCTDQPPNGLGIGDSIVLGTPETRALQEYTDYQISIANTTNWVLSLVAMIPCIQVCLLPFRVHGLLTRYPSPTTRLRWT